MADDQFPKPEPPDLKTLPGIAPPDFEPPSLPAPPRRPPAPPPIALPVARGIDPYAPPAANPYAPPSAGSLAADSAEAVRRKHISHEAAVKSIGLLYFLGSAGLFFGSLGFLAKALAPASGADFVQLLLAAFLLAIAAGYLFVGRGLRRLAPWVKAPVGVISGIGLLGFPLGTIINLYILYLVFSEKGKTVLSPDYQEIIAATPHVRYKTSVVVWIFVGLLLLIFAALTLIAFLG